MPLLSHSLDSDPIQMTGTGIERMRQTGHMLQPNAARVPVRSQSNVLSASNGKNMQLHFLGFYR